MSRHDGREGLQGIESRRHPAQPLETAIPASGVFGRDLRGAARELLREALDAPFPRGDELGEARHALEPAGSDARENVATRGLRHETTLGRAHAAIGDGDQILTVQQRVHGKLRVVRPFAPPVRCHPPGLVIDQDTRAVLETIDAIDAQFVREPAVKGGLAASSTCSTWKGARIDSSSSQRSSSPCRRLRSRSAQRAPGCAWRTASLPRGGHGRRFAPHSPRAAR
jgi:hypothetical protein